MQATYASAKTYFDIRIWAAPFVLANMALSGFLIGSGKTKWVLRALIVCNVVNYLLTFCLCLFCLLALLALRLPQCLLKLFSLA
ncbi:MATE family efflux transporter [Psychrosphaera haliotis]|uniref:MATE family efflux transporter n=1 Tax=Psychrosphaera haliotis TaxID=555083 RepID=A0A6N8FAE5_9GAMM|nr:hypothetical protein [Psychrosphaera haliotis]